MGKNIKSSFSIEMKSKNHVKNISISDEAHDRVLFEGNLGELVELSLVEGDVLEVVGINGIIRIAVRKEQLLNALRTTCQKEPKLRGGEL